MVKIKDFMKMGFGLGFGSTAAMIPFMLLGILLLMWGNSMRIKARRNGDSVYPAYGVMAVGCAIGLGMGSGTIMSGMEQNF